MTGLEFWAVFLLGTFAGALCTWIAVSWNASTTCKREDPSPARLRVVDGGRGASND